MKRAACEACHGDAGAHGVRTPCDCQRVRSSVVLSWLEKCCHQAGNISSGQWHERQHTHNPVTGRVRNAFAVPRDSVHEWRWHLSGDMGWRTQETHDAEWRHSPEANWIEAACNGDTSATFMGQSDCPTACKEMAVELGRRPRGTSVRSLRSAQLRWHPAQITCELEAQWAQSSNAEWLRPLHCVVRVDVAGRPWDRVI